MARTEPRDRPSPQASNRYQLLLPIASGGMASVYVGRIRGAAGFSRIVAIKRALPEIAADPDASRMFVDEARLAAKIHHPNIVAVHDVEELDGELWLVMDYVQGVSLTQLVRAANQRGESLPLGVAMRVIVDAATGLHAAHELTDELGRPLGLIHRDVSPQNILVGVDGTTRLTDFGIAKSKRPRLSRKTVQGILKGKTAYMAPEYVQELPIDARADIFGLGVVAWEVLANEPLFRGESDLETIQNVMTRTAPPLAARIGALDGELDRVLARALAKQPEERWPTAHAFGRALGAAARGCGLLPDASEVAACVRLLAGKVLAARQQSLRRLLEADAVMPGEDTATVPLQSRRASEARVEQHTAAIADPLELAEQLSLDAPTVVRPASDGARAPVPAIATRRDTPLRAAALCTEALQTDEPILRPTEPGTGEVTTRQLPVDEPKPAREAGGGPPRAWLVGGATLTIVLVLGLLALWRGASPSEDAGQAERPVESDGPAQALPAAPSAAGGADARAPTGGVPAVVESSSAETASTTPTATVSDRARHAAGAGATAATPDRAGSPSQSLPTAPAAPTSPAAAPSARASVSSAPSNPRYGANPY